MSVWRTPRGRRTAHVVTVDGGSRCGSWRRSGSSVRLTWFKHRPEHQSHATLRRKQQTDDRCTMCWHLTALDAARAAIKKAGG